MCRKFNSQTKEESGASERRTNSTNSNVGAANNCLNIPDYFRSSTNKETDKTVRRLLITKIHNEFSDIFTGIRCFEGTFKLLLREGQSPMPSPV